MRQRNADRLLEENQGHLSVETLQKIMADHSDYPYSLCRHATEDDPIYTTAAFVADLTNLQMHIAIGHACVSQWHTYQV
jgi:isopenicillin-N N-acyltransferase-like protein